MQTPSHSSSEMRTKLVLAANINIRVENDDAHERKKKALEKRGKKHLLLAVSPSDILTATAAASFIFTQERSQVISSCHGNPHLEGETQGELEPSHLGDAGGT